MRRLLRQNGLVLAMLGIFAVVLVGQSVAGWKDYNAGEEEARRALGRLRSVPDHRAFRRGRLRELGERVPI